MSRPLFPGQVNRHRPQPACHPPRQKCEQLGSHSTDTPNRICKATPPQLPTPESCPSSSAGTLHLAAERITGCARGRHGHRGWPTACLCRPHNRAGAAGRRITRKRAGRAVGARGGKRRSRGKAMHGMLAGSANTVRSYARRPSALRSRSGSSSDDGGSSSDDGGRRSSGGSVSGSAPQTPPALQTTRPPCVIQ